MVLPLKETKPMAFHEIQRGVFAGKKALTNSVKVAVTSVKTGAVHITVSRDVLAKIGDPMFLSVLIGEDEHAGRVALVPRNSRSASSYKISRPVSSCGKICLSANKLGIGKVMIKTTPVNFDITPDGVVIDLRPISQMQDSRVNAIGDITRKHQNFVAAAE